MSQRAKTIGRGVAQQCWLLLAVCLAGCGPQKMANQPKLEPLEPSDFFADGMASRPPVVGAVARGDRRDELIEYSQVFLTGQSDGQLTTTLPGEVTEQWKPHALLLRGQERFAIYCSHCHGLVGAGDGFVPSRGFPAPPTFHSQRMREQPLGYIFQVITDGRGRMAPHASIVRPEDRWAIAVYIKALQLSQFAPVAELTEEDRRQLDPQAP